MSLSEKGWAFVAGLAAGIGAACFVKSRAGRAAAVAVTAKGMKLKKQVAGFAERTKENLEDIAAEARQKANE